MTGIRHTIFRTVQNTGIPWTEIKTSLFQLNIFLFMQLWNVLFFTHSLAIRPAHPHELIKSGLYETFDTFIEFWSTSFVLKYMFLYAVSLKTLMVSLHPAHRQSNLSYQYSHYHHVTWKFVRNYFACFSRKAIQMENYLMPDHPLWTRTETYPLRDDFLWTITFQLLLN